MKKALVVYLLLGAGIAVQAAYYYPRLPDRVASHFDASGNPDDGMSRRSDVAVLMGVTAFVIALFLGTEAILRRIPISAVRRPHKDYWFAPERREATHKALSTEIRGIGCATLVFLAGVFQLSFQANLRPDRRLSDGVWVLLGLYLTFMFVWVVRFYYRFASIPDPPEPT